MFKKVHIYAVGKEIKMVYIADFSGDFNNQLRN